MIIESLTHHGMGRATDGSLIARTLPGEEVEVQPDGSTRILTPSADRVAAPCKHYKTCGGCAMQHARDAYVADWKTDIVAKALTGQGLVAEIAGITTSPAQSRRRARFSGRRTKKGAMVGFHARASDTLVAVPDCQLLSPELTALIPVLEALTEIGASRKSEINLIVTHSLAGPDVTVLTEKPLTSNLRIELAAFAQNHGLARLVWNEEPVVTLQPPSQKFGRALVVPPPGAFLQATAHAEAALVAEVRRITKGADRIMDLFAGCGTFALPLSEDAEVHAVESEPAMLKSLDAGWRVATGLKRINTEARDLFRRPMLPDEFKKIDAVVIDPPRAGAEAQVNELAQGGPPTVAMVSCNPITFARDGRILTAAGYRMGPVQVVDQFRWSTHVEVVAAFTRS